MDEIRSAEDLQRRIEDLTGSVTEACFQLLAGCPDTKTVQDVSYVIIRGIAGGLAAVLYQKRHGAVKRADDLNPGELDGLVNELLLGAFVKS